MISVTIRILDDLPTTAIRARIGDLCILAESRTAELELLKLLKLEAERECPYFRVEKYHRKTPRKRETWLAQRVRINEKRRRAKRETASAPIERRGTSKPMGSANQS